MTDDELNELVARWCGWTVYEESPGFWKARHPNGHDVSTANVHRSPAFAQYDFPAFASDLNAWPAVHALLEERERFGEYIDYVNRVLFPQFDPKTASFASYADLPGDYESDQALLTATARQRSEALAAMIGERDEGATL